jgi:hypothetical protein
MQGKLLIMALVVATGAALSIAPRSAARELTEEERQPIIKAIEVQKKALADDRLRIEVAPVQFAHNALNLAINMSAVGDKAGALSLFNEALNAYKTVPAENTENPLDSEFWRFLDRYLNGTEASADQLPLFFSVADIAEANSAKRRLTPSHHFFNCLGFFTNQEHFAEAIRVVEHVIEIRKKVRPADDQCLGELYDYLAEQHAKTKTLSALIDTANQWLSDSEKQFGVEDIRILPALVYSATLNIRLGNQSEADATAQRALSIVKNNDNQNDYEKLAPIVVAYLNYGRVDQADNLVRKICSGKNPIRSYDDPNHLHDSVRSVAAKYFKKHQYDEAASLLKVWLEVQSINLSDQMAIRGDLCKYYLKYAGSAFKDGNAKVSKLNIQHAEDMFSAIVAFYKRTHRDDAVVSEYKRWNREIESNKLPVANIKLVGQ